MNVISTKSGYGIRYKSATPLVNIPSGGIAVGSFYVKTSGVDLLQFSSKSGVRYTSSDPFYYESGRTFNGTKVGDFFVCSLDYDLLQLPMSDMSIVSSNDNDNDIVSIADPIIPVVPLIEDSEPVLPNPVVSSPIEVIQELEIVQVSKDSIVPGILNIYKITATSCYHLGVEINISARTAIGFESGDYFYFTDKISFPLTNNKIGYYCVAKGSDCYEQLTDFASKTELSTNLPTGTSEFTAITTPIYGIRLWGGYFRVVKLTDDAVFALSDSQRIITESYDAGPDFRFYNRSSFMRSVSDSNEEDTDSDVVVVEPGNLNTIPSNEVSVDWGGEPNKAPEQNTIPSNEVSVDWGGEPNKAPEQNTVPSNEVSVDWGGEPNDIHDSNDEDDNIVLVPVDTPTRIPSSSTEVVSEEQTEQDRILNTGGGGGFDDVSYRGYQR